jgi:DNA adenine methylase
VTEKTPTMKITALAPWFGSKRTLAPEIVTELGKHRAYWEPFCGSMAVLLDKPECGHETVNDLHGDLINLARVVQDARQGSELYRRLRRVLMTEQCREDSVAALGEATDPVDRAFHFFLTSWIGRNGFCGTVGSEKSSFAVRWTPGGGHGGQRLASAVGSIPAWRRRIRRVTILRRDAFDVLAKIDDTDGVAIYVDPPYLAKAARYVHDFDSHGGGIFGDDHTQLARAVSRFTKARVVVSYYAHDRLADLYPPDRWTLRDCSINKGIHNAGKRGSDARTAPEVLLINGPSYAGGAA